jgi:hypothetical protein
MRRDAGGVVARFRGLWVKVSRGRGRAGSERDERLD